MNVAQGSEAAVRRAILPYPPSPLQVDEHDPRTLTAAETLIALIHERRPGLGIHHVGSSAVPGLAGKNVVDLAVAAEPEDIPGITEDLLDLGFQRQTSAGAFPPTRPLMLGAIEHEGVVLKIHVHVTADPLEIRRYLTFRDALRTDPGLRETYARTKYDIASAGVTDTISYSMNKTVFIQGAVRALGVAEGAIPAGSTIGILGGGQLGRMLAMAARHLGYRVAVLDPDPSCPAGPVADRLIVAGYDDVAAARELGKVAAVVTCELEHVARKVVEALDETLTPARALLPVRPGVFAVATTQDRLLERHFLEASHAPVAPWREVRARQELDNGARELGYPLRLKAARGGYDGRSQLRLTGADDLDHAWATLGGSAEEAGLVLERELEYLTELSAIVARGPDGHSVPFPVAANRHDEGILAESVAPAPPPVTPRVAKNAQALATRLAMELDLVGTLTVELFLIGDGSLVVNELAPRVHNSGHWTIEGCATSQFEQHVRAICGLPLGSVEAPHPAAMVNLLGTGPDRNARAMGIEEALSDPGVHLHLYDKRGVFERRKMGHVTVVAETREEALARARSAAAKVTWEDA
ncbi:MAG: 5-(carboxyamino)imidazole ribonucleotide synthase [Chloroflexi bacterium]|nr:MAG: 5-(carboxyamino)imidazole ribonucleotide synthase [Chloroflexota bacterium]